MQWEDTACEVHGDRLIIDCQVCGREFCGLCSGNRRICEACEAAQWDGGDGDLDGDEADDQDLDLSLDDDEDEPTG